ncbi:MAG: CoxG family protein [Gammaproteobacteria bacterium]
MKMVGEQRIAASRQKVWEALYDPDVLRRCIPGCQSLAKESDTRMVAVAEIKIGPIGARFNGAVELSDIDPLNAYTMTIEGQGGTVGSVKSIARVRLSDDGNGGSVLAYEVDAQVAGRLAQLGGPIMDATAKQLAARFFTQFGKNVGVPVEVPAAAAAAAVARPALPAAAPSAGSRLAWVLSVVVAGLVGYLIGRSMGVEGQAEWMGIAIGALLVIVGAAGFEYGRRAAAPVVTLDAQLLAKLLEVPKP